MYVKCLEQWLAQIQHAKISFLPLKSAWAISDQLGEVREQGNVPMWKNAQDSVRQNKMLDDLFPVTSEPPADRKDVLSSP